MGEVALFVLVLRWLVRLQQNKMCHLCSCPKIKKQKMREAKNKTSLPWLSGRAVRPSVSLCVNVRVITFRFNGLHCRHRVSANYLILAIKICQLINFKFIGAVAPGVNIPIARTKIIIMYSVFYK